MNLKDLAGFDGKGKYSPLELTWIPPVAPTALKFFNSDKLGSQMGFLEDKIANSIDEQGMSFSEMALVG